MHIASVFITENVCRCLYICPANVVETVERCEPPYITFLAFKSDRLGNVTSNLLSHFPNPIQYYTPTQWSPSTQHTLPSHPRVPNQTTPASTPTPARQAPIAPIAPASQLQQLPRASTAGNPQTCSRNRISTLPPAPKSNRIQSGSV